MKHSKEKEYYTTGEASKEIGVSFRTIKRWIKEGRIKYTKTKSGRYLIPREEVLFHREKKSLQKEILSLLNERKAIFLREAQLYFEDRFFHFVTYRTIKSLQERGRIKESSYGGLKWYHLSKYDIKDILDIIKSKLEIYNAYRNHPRECVINGEHYDDYSEYLVERALLKSRFKIVAKNTNYFNGIRYRGSGKRGPSPDLDFILYADSVFIGVQVKNRLGYPDSNVINTLIDMCNYLGLRPMLITRVAHPSTYVTLSKHGGWVISFKQYFLKPPFPREVLEKARSLGIPVAVYKDPPEYLIKLLDEAYKRLISKV